MQRGRGNPNRGAPSKEIYAQAIGIKFKAWRTLFSQEQFLGTVTQIPAVKEELLQQWFEQRIKETGEDQFETGWFDFFRVKREVEAKEASIDQDFYKSFLAWLLGKGKPSDHEKTPWGREAHAVQLPEVRALMDAFLDEISEVENAIAKLLFRGPQTLNEYFLYYKYILQHDRYLLIGDPWFFLEWKRYAGKPDKNGREYRMGEDGKPVVDDQNWIKIRDVFAETGERQVAILERIRQDLSEFQTITNQRLVDERRAIVADLKLNQNTAAKERVEMGLSEEEDEVDAWLKAMETNTEAMKDLAESLRTKPPKGTVDQPFGVPSVEESDVEAQAAMLVDAGVDLDVLMEQATEEFEMRVNALAQEKKINPIMPPVLVKVFQLMKAIESQYEDKSKVPSWVRVAKHQAVQLTTEPSSMKGSLEIENLWARVQGAIVRRQAQKHIAVPPSEVLPPVLELSQLDEPPATFQTPEEEVLEKRSVSPPPEK